MNDLFYLILFFGIFLLLVAAVIKYKKNNPSGVSLGKNDIHIHIHTHAHNSIWDDSKPIAENNK